MTHSRYARARFFALLGVAVLSLVVAACGNDAGGEQPATGGPTRPFMLGLSSLPRELNAESYAATIEFAGEHGDLLLIQRTVPWSEFTPGATISDDTAESTTSEREAVRGEGLELFFSIDPTDAATGRDRLVALPDDLAGRRFDDADVRAAFLAYAEYVAINYKPEYLALGVEMNLYYEKNQDDWDNVRSLYAEAYAAVKKASPGTQITVTLQYEDLQGLLPRDDPHRANWQLVRAFDPLDFIAISTYPSFAFASPEAIPANYYSQLTAFANGKPIAIAEMGYASSNPAGASTELEQAGFLRRVLEEAGDLSMMFAVWFAIWDPSYAQDTEFDALGSIGLRRADDTEKAAWEAWAAAAARPYEE